MSAINILEELRQSYLLGLPTQFEEMENLVLEIEKGNNFQENFEAIYRKVHSLKGSGGTYGFTILSSICHQLEDFLTDEIDSGENIDQSKINIIFAHIDILKDAHTILSEGKYNFSEIEDNLYRIKQKTSSGPQLKALIVGTVTNLYGQICSQILTDAKISHTTSTSGVTAIQRSAHEHFDILITSQENTDLCGTALIAATIINNKITKREIKTILITSNSEIDVPNELKPDYIIKKGSDFSEKLNQAIENIISKA